MTCRAARRRLPLFAGGDLKAPEMSAVAAHVGVCAACRAEVDAFAAARSLLPLSTLSFGETERARIRRLVLDEIATRQEDSAPFASFGRRPRFVLAALAGVVVLAASLVSPFFARNAGEPAASLPAGPVPSATPVFAGENLVEAAPLSPDRSTTIARAPHAWKAHRRSVPASKLSGPAIRLEIQTGNANVRIIWFVGGNSGEEPSSGSAGDPNDLS